MRKETKQQAGKSTRKRLTNYELYHGKRIFITGYHGIKQDFIDFDFSFKGSITEERNCIHGFYFTELPEIASLFGNRIIKAEIEITKPIDIRLHSLFSEMEQASFIWSFLSGETFTNEEALAIICEEIGLGEIGDVYDVLHTEYFHFLLRENGYNRIISDLGRGYSEYCVFEGTQIKQIPYDSSIILDISDLKLR